MQDTLLEPILSNTFALTEFYRRVDMLQHFLEWLFFEKRTGVEGNRAQLFREFYKDANEEERSHAAAIAGWGDPILSLFTMNNVYAKVQELKQALEQLPRLTLYVPVKFSSAHIASIGTWCRTQVDRNIVLDLKIDPEVVGGCAYAYQNVYHDFSLSYFIEKEHDAFQSLIRTYGA